MPFGPKQKVSTQLRTPSAILRLTATFLSIPTIVVCTVAFAAFGDDFYSDGLRYAYECLPLGPAVWSILWNIISLLLTFFLGWYHPGADIAMDFLAWSSAWAIGSMLLYWTTYADYTEFCNNGSYDPCSSARALEGLEYTGGVLAVIIGLCHLILFIEACRAAHALRLRKRDTHVELRPVH